MGPRYQAVKGTRDVFPPESERFAQAETIAREVFSSHGYGEVRTPCLEPTELFARSVGETTDIVHKEMYTFADRKGRSLTLRPENTAGVVRAVVEAGLATGPMPLRLWYEGPQFRYERPQAGRYREFRQIGVELFGVASASGEAEVLRMLFAFLHALGFRSLSVSLNSVGTSQSRAAFGEALRGHLEPKASAFSEDDRRKIEQNPLRLFDSKDPAVRAALEGSPRTLDFLDDASRRHHEEVRRLLGEAGIPFKDDPSLVRGLDYYTRTVFEVVSADLGAQDAVLGGGRYDNLVEALGGPSLPAIGFAIGEDRLLEAAPFSAAARACVLVIPQDAEHLDDALRLAAEIRQSVPDASVEVDLLARGFKKGMARANALFEAAPVQRLDPGRMFAVLLGAQERQQGTVTAKKLDTAEQTMVRRNEIGHWLATRLAEARA
ncbi:MAG TPA: histidine--tRNA ligase [Thermoanaerobaculia bacterium]|nr:histidine--tRNA ligase [Thermoanaerobaculia bacterium]